MWYSWLIVRSLKICNHTTVHGYLLVVIVIIRMSLDWLKKKLHRKPWVFPMKYRGFHGFSVHFPKPLSPRPWCPAARCPVAAPWCPAPSAQRQHDRGQDGQVLHVSCGRATWKIFLGTRCSAEKKKQQTSATHGSVSKPCTPGEHQNSW